MWFLIYWVLSILIVYFVARLALKSDPDFLEEGTAIFIFVMFVPILNLLSIAYCLYSLSVDHRLTEKKFAHKFFLVKEKK